MIKAELSFQTRTKRKTLHDVPSNGERNVLALITQGFSNGTIAEHMDLAQKTIEGHINEIFSKLRIIHRNGTSDPRAEAANAYIDQNPDFKNPFAEYETHQPFTDSEKEILNYVGQGLSDGKIAEKLHISKRTVQRHTNKILNKIKMTDKAKRDPRITMLLVSKGKPKVPTEQHLPNNIVD